MAKKAKRLTVKPRDITKLRQRIGVAKGWGRSISQQELGVLLHVSLMTVSRWERGIHVPGPMASHLLAGLLAEYEVAA